MPKFLVVGANAGQADLIRCLKLRGHTVIACSANKNDVGAGLSDQFEHVDVRDLEALAMLISQHSIDYVYSVSSDLAIRSVTSVSERMGLPHFYNCEFIELLEEKTKLRTFLNEQGISYVDFELIEEGRETYRWSQFPCVVKPLDAQGQRGVVFVQNAAEMDQAIQKARAASPTGRVIVEEFLQGIEISCNVVLNKGAVRVAVLSERIVHAKIGAGLPKGHLVPPINVSHDDLAKADQLVRDIITEMKVSDGPLYFQMVVTSAGPKVIEIAPRLDGCHLWRLIKESHGIDLIEMVVDTLLGIEIRGAEASALDQRKLELMFQQAPPGTIMEGKNFPIPENALFHEYRYVDGQVVLPINGILEVVGYYVRESLG